MTDNYANIKIQSPEDVGELCRVVAGSLHAKNWVSGGASLFQIEMAQLLSRFDNEHQPNAGHTLVAPFLFVDVAGNCFAVWRSFLDHFRTRRG